MPASSFSHLADSDVAAIVAYVRSVPAAEDSLPRTQWGLLARALMANSTLPFPVDDIDHDVRPPVEPDRGDPMVFGRYLAMSICSECHGPDLEGQTEFMVTPNLAVAATYSPDAFRTLLRTGMPLDGRDLGTMAEVARSRFTHYSDAEIEALHTYLSSLGGGG
jgi:mono/diheme cytochrome c family protein